MELYDFIITIYCKVDDFCKQQNIPLEVALNFF